jgi:hypothetical protein
MSGEPCPVCEARRQTTDEDESDQLKPSYRCLCWVIDRDNEKAGPMVWSMPISLFRDINARSVDKKSNAPILIDDPEEGYDIVFNRAGTDKRTKYTAVEVMREASPLHDDEKLQKRWLDYVQEHPLPSILNFFDAAQIEKVLFGKARKEEESEEVESETRPSRRGRSEREEEVAGEPAPRSSRRQAAAEETDDELPFDKNGKGEETPRQTRRRTLLDEEKETPEEEVTSTRGRRGAPEAIEEETPVRAARRSLERLRTRERA